MNLPEISVNKPVTITMIILILLVLGAVAFTRLGLDFFPDIQFPEVAVITTYPGASSHEIETLITKPLEEAVATVSGVRKVKSSSREGVSIIRAEMEWGTNLDASAQDIRNMMDITYDFMPDEVDRPLVIKSNVDMIPILYYGVTSSTGRNLRNLRKLVEDYIEKRVENISGVASVTVSGGHEREILIEVDRDKLKAHNISLDDIIAVIRAQNKDIPGGHLTQGTREYIIRTMGRFKTPLQISNTILKVENGTPTYIKDVALVRDTHKEVRNINKTNGRDSVIFWVTKESGTNTVQVVDDVKSGLRAIKKTLPPDITIVNVWDTSKIIRDSVSQLKTTVRWGGLITVVVLFAFLWNVRTTLTLIFSIPFAIITTFVAIYFADYTLNIITLSGLALGVGMIVDNSIVVLENIFRHIEQGEEKKEAAKRGATEMSMAITASTLTTVIVFVPLVFASGITGQLTKPLGLTVTFALMASLLVALTLVPMLASKIIRITGSKKEEKFYHNLRQFYKRLIEFSLHHRPLVVLSAFLVFIISILLMKYTDREFIPKLDEIYSTGVVRLAPGTSLDESYKFISQIEHTIMSQPDFRAIVSLTGLSEASKFDLAMGAGPAGVNESEIFYEIAPKNERNRTSLDFLAAVRANLPDLPDGSYHFLQTTDYFTMGSERPIEIKIFGSDLNVLKTLSDRVEQILKSVKGVIEVDKSLRMGKPELQIEVDREKASSMGITAGLVAETVDAAFLGKDITKYRDAGDEYDIRVKFSEPDRHTMEDLKNLLITSPMGFQVNLEDIARVSEGRGPIEIKRENQERVASVSGNYYGRDLGSIMEEITARLKKITFPEGYFYHFGGAIEDMAEMMSTMLWVLGLIILLVYMVMAAQFESLSHPFAIMFAVPLAFIGVALSLLLTGISLSVMSFIGIMMLVGIVVNNGIVYIDCINQLRKDGMEKNEAIIKAGTIRLRPILMTTMTTVFALIPMALSRGEGSELFSPIAIVIFGGLLTSTFLTLIIVPSIYSIIDDIAGRAKKAVQQ